MERISRDERVTRLNFCYAVALKGILTDAALGPERGCPTRSGRRRFGLRYLRQAIEALSLAKEINYRPGHGHGIDTAGYPPNLIEALRAIDRAMLDTAKQKAHLDRAIECLGFEILRRTL
jgi:hypothetical protein